MQPPTGMPAPARPGEPVPQKKYRDDRKSGLGQHPDPDKIDGVVDISIDPFHPVVPIVESEIDFFLVKTMVTATKSKYILGQNIAYCYEIDICLAKPLTIVAKSTYSWPEI